MTLDELDHELDQLRAALEHIGANLVAVEQDPTVALLDLADLRGESAELWGSARVALADLFGSYTALGSVVERAIALRGTHRWLAAMRTGELTELLRGRSVVVTGVTVALTDRPLLGSSRTATRWEPAALVEQMSASFDEIRAVVAAAARTWDVAVARTRAVRQRLTALADLASPAASRGRLAAELEALSTAVLADPLTFDWGRLDRIESDTTDAEHASAAAAELHDDRASTIDAARALLVEVTAAVAAAAETAARTSARIVIPAAVATVEPTGDLTADLERIAARAADGRWSEAAAELVVWRATTDARRSTALSTAAEHDALLLVRAELRGRLDAYHAKADRGGRLEDPVVTTLHRQAHDALYTAPTDLDAAAELVRRYGEVLAAPRPVPCGGSR